MNHARGPRDNQPWPAMGLADLLEQWCVVQTALLLAVSALVGLSAGAGAVILHRLIATSTTFVLRDGGRLLTCLGAYRVMVIPTLGGFLVGGILTCLGRHAAGHGVPDVIEAVVLRGGRMRPVATVMKLLAASICLGTGGSVGPEESIIHMGAGLGSTLGQWLRLSANHLRSLVACGAAGGIAATFNAPVAGVVFALEVILGTYDPTSFCTVVIASVSASEVAHVMAGNTPAFMVPPYVLLSLWEFPLYAVLGLAAAVVGVVFTGMLNACYDVFEHVVCPAYLKPVGGGLLIGVIGFVFPQIFGGGYETITQALQHELSLHLMAVLLVVKMLTTSCTIASGGAGGFLVPLLFLGAMLGGSFGTVVHTLLPTVTALPATYALVGMAAVFAAAARAPMTAILILFELTGNARIILPLLLTTVIATFLAERLSNVSIYTMTLSRRGIRMTPGRTLNVLQTVQVGEVMGTQVDTVTTTMGLAALAQLFECLPHHSYLVLDTLGALHGTLNVQDLKRTLASDATSQPTAGDIATTTLQTVYPDEPVSSAIRRMGTHDLSCLPVVQRDSRRLLGIIHRDDVGRAFNVEMRR